MSVREIERNGINYGIGVYLDSTLLDNLTDKERVQMIKERVKELGGQSFTAYDQQGNAVTIKIAEAGRRYKNKNGKSVSVTGDLARKNIGSKLKQETVVLVDEVIVTAKNPSSSEAKYPHGWLDNNGQNHWTQWKTYLQDKSGKVWEAILHVANANDGIKYLYDIDINKIKQTGQRGVSRATLPGVARKSRTSLPRTSIDVEAGNVNTKIKKSERDAEYLSAVKRGDLETARGMVNEAAKDAEYDITAYHVSMNGAFNVFDRNRLGENTADYADDVATAATAYLGFWFSDHDVSKPTRNYGIIPGDARQFWLKAETLYPIALQTLQDELLNEYISEDAMEQYSAGEYSAIREAAEEYAAELQRRGYSGLEVQDSELGGTSYVVFDPEQIKSADAVVYDDKGEVIPLSERFNAKRSDIRYSMRDVTTDDTREELAQRKAAYARLDRENAELRKRVDYFKGQTKKTREATVRGTDVAKYAWSILKDYTSRADRAEVSSFRSRATTSCRTMRAIGG